MKSLRGYPATYSPVSYEDVDIAHLNYEEENAPKNYLEQIRYLLEEGNAGGYVSAFDRGFSGGLGRKVGGFINAVGSYPVDRAAEWLGYENVPSFSDHYNEIVQQADAREQQLRQEHPYAALGTEMLGNALGLGNAAYGIAGRFGLNGVTRMGSAGAIDAAVNTFGGSDNLSDAVTTLPQNTVTGFVGGAVMGKIGEYGSKYGGQVLDWGQNKLGTMMNNRMQGILTDTSEHSLNIPEIAARHQQIYDNFIFQNADKEVLDFTPTRRQLESYIAQSKFNPNKNYTKEKAEQVLRERLSETNLNVFNDNLSNLGNSELGINHFLKEGKDPYVRTAARTYLYPDLKFTKDGTDYYVRKYFNNKSNKAFQDMFLVREGKAFNKLPSSNNHIANKLRGAQDLSLAPALRAMTTTGASPSDINITLQPVVVNKKLPNVSNLYNELTANQVEMMDNVLRQGLGQSAHKNHPV